VLTVDVIAAFSSEADVSVTFGFGAGTVGAFGFPVELLDLVPLAEVIVEDVTVTDSSIFSFSSSTFFLSSSPPGRVRIVSLASFSLSS